MIRFPSISVLLLPMLLCIASSVRGQEPVARIQVYQQEAAKELPEKVRNALARIADANRRLLATNYYFRRLDEIETGWTWTTDEVRAFQKSEEYRVMLREIESVRKIFADSNAGYSLAVNISARSLSAQLNNWNTVASVRLAAAEFLDSTLALFADTALLPLPPTPEALDRFRRHLSTFELDSTRVPTVAVPGLSKHGQLRAFDFKVMKGKRLVAGATASTIPAIWEASGWTERLRQAVAAVSGGFEGPLSVPYEPWHYNYRISGALDQPATDTIAAVANDWSTSAVLEEAAE